MAVNWLRHRRGAAFFGAVAGGAFKNVREAQRLVKIREKVYEPNPEAVAAYRKLFSLYSRLHDAFGLASWSGSLFEVMKALIASREEARRR